MDTVYEGTWSKTPFSKLWRPQFFSALIKCQRRLLPSLRKTAAEKTYPSEAQKIAFEVTEFLLKHHGSESCQSLIDAGLVNGWLAFLPFQTTPIISLYKCPSASDVVRSLIESGDGDPWQSRTLQGIFSSLLSSAAGRRSLEACGLWDRVCNSKDNATRPLRHKAKGISSQNRQRREAVVISEGGRPLERGDIIQWGGETFDTDAEEVLEQLREEQATSNELQTNTAPHISLSTWPQGLQSCLPLR